MTSRHHPVASISERREWQQDRENGNHDLFRWGRLSDGRDYTPNAPAANINYTLCLNAGPAEVREGVSGTREFRWTDGTVTSREQRSAKVRM
jgi:hypothetical protein